MVPGFTTPVLKISCGLKGVWSTKRFVDDPIDPRVIEDAGSATQASFAVAKHIEGKPTRGAKLFRLALIPYGGTPGSPGKINSRGSVGELS